MALKRNPSRKTPSEQARNALGVDGGTEMPRGSIHVGRVCQSCDCSPPLRHGAELRQCACVATAFGGSGLWLVLGRLSCCCVFIDVLFLGVVDTYQGFDRLDHALRVPHEIAV